MPTTSNPITVKFVKRLAAVTDEKIAGQVLFCTDTLEVFFDQNTKTRLCLGRMRALNFTADLEPVTEDDVDSFVLILDEMSIKYATKDMEWIDVKTRDEMVELLGDVSYFTPHNMVKDGKLIAPRTLASCVYDDYGVPIGESLNYLQDYIDKMVAEGIAGEMITSGTIDWARIPKEARMDFVPVADTEARLKLTKDQVQDNDIVQEDSTGKMFFVVDDTKLGTEAAFKEFTVGSIPWNSVINRPMTLSLKDGAVGTTLLNTGSTLASQKLTISAKLNVDHVDSGILSVTHGGTGNQRGEAPYVKCDISNDTMNLVGYKSDKSLGRSNNATIKAGIISASGFTATDDNVSSRINNLHSDVITLDKSNGEHTIQVKTSRGTTNIVKARNLASSLVFGQKGVNVDLLGYDTRISLSIDGISLTYMETESTGRSLAKLNNTEFYIWRPLKATKFAIKNGPGEGYTDDVNIAYDWKNRICAWSNLNVAPTYTIASSTTNAAAFSSKTKHYVFRKDPNVGIVGVDNIVDITSTDVAINGGLNIATNLNIAGTITSPNTINATCKTAENATKFAGNDVSVFMKADGSNASNPNVIVQDATPAGRTNCLWIHKTSGVPKYWNGSSWVTLANVWK